MRASVLAAMLFCLSAVSAAAQEYPIKDASSAIEIAKLVCKRTIVVNVEWRAKLSSDGSQ